MRADYRCVEVGVDCRWRLVVSCTAALALFGLGPGARSLEPVAVAAQEKTVEQGVYTTAQAARGAKTFETHCTACHREPGGTAPILAGERFAKTFGDATLQTVFTTIKTTMPRSAPGTLTDAEYTDIVAHLLRINSYADGMSELALRRHGRHQDSRGSRAASTRRWCRWSGASAGRAATGR